MRTIVCRHFIRDARLCYEVQVLGRVFRSSALDRLLSEKPRPTITEVIAANEEDARVCECPCHERRD